MTNVSITITHNKPPAHRGEFAFVRHCFQSPVTGYRRYMSWRGYSEKEYDGDPSVWLLYAINNQKPVWTTEPIQWWIYDEGIRKPSEGTMTEVEMIKAWYNLMMGKKAFTNKISFESGRADWIQKLNLSNKQGIGVMPVVASGATIKTKGDPFQVNDKDSEGKIWLQPFEICNAMDKNITSIRWAIKWWLFMAATVSVNVGESGERIDTWPKMKDDRDTLFPFLGNNDTGLIDTRWLDYLDFEPTKPLYPYYPFRNRGGIERWDTRRVR